MKLTSLIILGILVGVNFIFSLIFKEPANKMLRKILCGIFSAAFFIVLNMN